MSAVCLMVSKMPSIESSTGRTKQAESCCSGRPAFPSVGELGRKLQRGHQVVEARFDLFDCAFDAARLPAEAP